MHVDKLRRAPFHKSLSRPNLVFGAEREPALMAALLSFTLVFVGMTWLTLLVGILFWSITIGALRLAAKAHPQMSHVYRRSIKYKKFYPARDKTVLPKPWDVIRK